MLSTSPAGIAQGDYLCRPKLHTTTSEMIINQKFLSLAKIAFFKSPFLFRLHLYTHTPLPSMDPLFGPMRGCYMRRKKKYHWGDGMW